MNSLLEILPRSGFLPPKQWDFKTGSFATNEVWLRDHGNELITGLAELACIECLESRPRCGTYIPPLLTMMDLLLAKFLGLTPERLAEWMKPGRYVSGREFAEAGLAELIDLQPRPQ